MRGTGKGEAPDWAGAPGLGGAPGRGTRVAFVVVVLPLMDVVQVDLVSSDHDLCLGRLTGHTMSHDRGPLRHHDALTDVWKTSTPGVRVGAVTSN